MYSHGASGLRPGYFRFQSTAITAPSNVQQSAVPVMPRQPLTPQPCHCTPQYLGPPLHLLANIVKSPMPARKRTPGLQDRLPRHRGVLGGIAAADYGLKWATPGTLPRRQLWLSARVSLYTANSLYAAAAQKQAKPQRLRLVSYHHRSVSGFLLCAVLPFDSSTLLLTPALAQ